MTNQLTTQQLYDLFMIGLWRLRKMDESTLARPGQSVWGAYMYASIITKTQRKAINTDYKLMGLVMENADIAKASRNFRKRELTAMIEGSGKHLAILIVPEAGPDFTKFFGAGGYDQLITDAGIRYAASVEEEYLDFATPDAFAEGWGKHKKATRRAKAMESITSDDYTPSS